MVLDIITALQGSTCIIIIITECYMSILDESAGVSSLSNHPEHLSELPLPSPTPVLGLNKLVVQIMRCLLW